MASYVFLPSVGGIELFTEMLATEFCARGHSVKVVTMTPAMGAETYPFEIVRRPPPMEFLKLLLWCDIFVHNNISLRLAWPLLFVWRPWVVSIHSPLFGGHGFFRFRLFMKRAVLRFAHVVCCSREIASQLGPKALFIPNPYRASLFRSLTDGTRPYDLVFLGRLVSDKGMEVLLRAIALLRQRNCFPRLLVIGGGPEEATLRAQCTAEGLISQVEFSGTLRGAELVKRLNQCRIMVVPSVYPEPFPVVPLEGIACGCVVIASHVGGLPDGVGPCGLTFPPGDAAALAERIATLLEDNEKIREMKARSTQHLARHQPDTAAGAYLAVLEKACSSA